MNTDITAVRRVQLTLFQVSTIYVGLFYVLSLNCFSWLKKMFCKSRKHTKLLQCPMCCLGVIFLHDVIYSFSVGDFLTQKVKTTIVWVQTLSNWIVSSLDTKFLPIIACGRFMNCVVQLRIYFKALCQTSFTFFVLHEHFF